MKKSILFLGVSGKKGHGKDSVYNTIKSRSIIPTYRVSFGDSLKKIYSIITDIPIEKLHDEKFKSTLAPNLKNSVISPGKMKQIESILFGKNETLALQSKEKLKAVLNSFIALTKQNGNTQTIRTHLQLLGTESFRQRFGENVWIDCVSQFLKEKLCEIYPSCAVFVFTDVRFENEAKFVSDLPNSFMWRVNRTFENTEKDSHPSECALDDKINLFDAILENNSTLYDFEELVYKNFLLLVGN